MKRIALLVNGAAVFVIAGMLAIGPAAADRPPWAGGGKGGKSEHRGDEERSPERAGHAARGGEYFGDRQRTMVHDYYHGQFRAGHCPPGLAKKHNGCMPPGQAKKWAVGRPLPRDVIYYDVPRDLVVQLGQPPAGYRYARVASDILLIAIGTGMVADAIQDLGGR